MFDRYVAPEIRDSFRRKPYNFVSKNMAGFFSCPPFVIASTAERYLLNTSDSAKLALPEGYDSSVLGSITSRTGWPGEEVAVSFRQAAELAMVGFQIQDLDKEGALAFPLTPFKKQSVDHLLSEVCLLNFDDVPGSHDVSEADIAYISTVQLLVNGQE